MEYYSEPNKHLSAWVGRQGKEGFEKEEVVSNPTEILSAQIYMDFMRMRSKAYEC